MDKQKLVDIARQWLGTPFRHEGRSATGVDCYGLLIVVAQQAGIDVPIESGYGKRPSGAHMRSRLLQYADPVPITDIQAGDILHIKFNAQPQHLAIVSSVAPLRIIHADAIAGRVVEHGLSDEWRAKVRGCYRVAG